MYKEGEYDLAGFAVGVVEKSGIIDGSRIVAGDAVLGIASSGPHSNGFSLIRRIVADSGVDLGAPFDATTLGGALLAPTRIYVKPVLALIARRSGQGHGAHHRRGTAGKRAAHARTRPSRRACRARSGTAPRSSTGCRTTATSPTRKCIACSTAASAWRSWSPRSMPSVRSRRSTPPGSARIASARSSRNRAGEPATVVL